MGGGVGSTVYSDVGINKSRGNNTPPNMSFPRASVAISHAPFPPFRQRGDSAAGRLVGH